MSKKELRDDHTQMLKDLNDSEKKEIEKKVHDDIFASDYWKNAQSIGVTVSGGIEWDTHEIIEQAWKDNKKVSVPKSIHKTRELHFYEITDFDQLDKGYYNIMEPNPEKTTRTQKEDMDLIVVPGIAFNKQGYRIGFGGGFYDRFLEDYKGEKISQQYSKQITDRVDPLLEEFDVPTNVIFTEKEIINAKENRE